MVTMVTLIKSDVPEYLHESAFFQSLEEGEEFSLCIEHFKADCLVHNIEDLVHLLTVLRFWGVTNAPDTLLWYAVNHPVCVYESIVKHYWEELIFLKDIVRVMSMPSKERVNIALEASNMCLVDILLKSGCSFDKSSSMIAAANGDVTLLTRIVQESNGRLYCDDVCLAAARSGSVPCLQFIFEYIRPCVAVKFSSCKEAALSGHFRFPL